MKASFPLALTGNLVLFAAFVPASTAATLEYGVTQATSARIPVEPMVMATKRVHYVTPVYPRLALQARIEGVVRLKVMINKEGDVSELEVVSGHPLLVQSAIDAVRQWKYTPTLFEGQPAEVVTTIDVTFALRSGDDPPTRQQMEAAGAVSGSLYTNWFFGFSYTFPRGFAAVVGPERRKLAESAGLQYPEDRIALLYAWAAQHEPQENAPAVFINSFDRWATPDTSPLSSLQVILSGMEKAGIRWRGKPKQKRYGGRRFWQAEGEGDMDFGGKKYNVHMVILLTESRELPLMWMFGSPNKKELKSLLKTAKSIRFSDSGTKHKKN